MATATATKSEKAKILATLTSLGGAQASDDDLEFKGTRLVVPKAWSVDKAVKVLQRYKQSQEQITTFSRSFRYRPWDGAAATARALKRVTGFSGLPKAMRSFFGSTPPALMTIPIGPHETMQVPWGAVEVPLLDGTLYLSDYTDEEFGLLFSLNVEAPRKHAAAIEGLFTVIEEELVERSIYRGKAFDGKTMPDFLNLEGVDRSKVIYSDVVEEQLDANIWGVMRHPEVMRRNDVPLKRSVLIHGPYGTGKTLAAHLTAQVAVETEWTFIQCRPGKDDILAAMATARLYQPSVVFFEDVDHVSSGEHTTIEQLLDVFDGIGAKSTEILAILTTNHPELIHKGMIRPGRLDAIIEVANLDQGGIERFINAKVDAEQLAPDLDLEAIAVAMDQYLPAFVSEAIDRTKRYAISRTGEDPVLLTTQDFVQAAEGLRTQFEMMNDAGEGAKLPTLDQSFKETTAAAIQEEIEMRADWGVGEMVRTGNGENNT